MTHASQAHVQVQLAGMRPGRPPQLRLALDFSLENRSDEPRWFVLPRNLGGEEPEDGGVDTLEVYALGGADAVLLGRFLGSRGFHAVRLGPGAALQLRQLPVSFWGELPEGVLPIEIAVAREVRLGGEEAQAWFAQAGKDATASRGEGDAGAAELVGSHKTADDGEVPVELVEPERLTAQLSLAR